MLCKRIYNLSYSLDMKLNSLKSFQIMMHFVCNSPMFYFHGSRAYFKHEYEYVTKLVIGSDNELSLFIAKPFYEPILTYCQLDPTE